MSTTTIRLDKYLALRGDLSRSESVNLIRSGCVSVNNQTVRDSGMKIKPEDEVRVRGEIIRNEQYQYYLLNKPAGILTAARDNHAKTVMDLMPSALSKRDVLPVGRLDKDTTGLLLLTNDGALAHDLLSPKKHVNKQYIAHVEGKLLPEHTEAFAHGMDLGDFTSMPAILEILSAEDKGSIGRVTLKEGKFHQVKRMFSAVGHEVVTLHRETFGPLTLPPDSQPGEYRELTADEIAALKSAPGNTGEE